VLRAALALLAVGCGPSLSTIETARYARYDAPFATVWSAVVDELRRRYPSIQAEDAVRGVVATAWRVVDVGAADPADRQAANTPARLGAPLGAAADLPAGVSDASLVRMVVTVKGPPWGVAVEGEGARVAAGLQLAPYRRHAADEPPWVQARIDNLSVAIHERLAPYAVATSSNRPRPRAAAALDTSAWQNLGDPELIGLIGRVRMAARTRNAGALRADMTADFRWAAGAAGSADTAIAMWSADPTVLQTLAATLDAGCGLNSDVVCAGPAATARFRKVGAAWKFIELEVR
jgi:hypothetical protein